MKVIYSIILLFALVGCLEEEETDIKGTIEVEAISPEPGSTLPDLGDKVEFTFENITWDLKNLDEGEEIGIVVWFVELSDSDAVKKVGWRILTTSSSSGSETITSEMTSWNHSHFSSKPTTLSLAICKSKELVEGLLNQCTEITATETFEYQ